MKILLTENQLSSIILNEYNIADGNASHNPYKKKFENAKERLKKLIDIQGKTMVSMENGDEYKVYEIVSLGQMLGTRYCICRIIKDNETQGTVMVKPMALFKEKIM